MNYVKIKRLLSIFLLPFSFLYASNNNSDCASPTHYVMQFLAKSGTKWKGSYQWLQNVKDNKSVETNYMRIGNGPRGQNYSGAIIKLHDLSCKFAHEPTDTVKGHFKISRESDGYVKITSYIKDTQVREVTDLGEIAEIKEKIRLSQEKSEDKEHTDYCSRCTHKIVEVKFDGATNMLHITMQSSCESTIPFELFVKSIEKYKHKF